MYAIVRIQINRIASLTRPWRVGADQPHGAGKFIRPLKQVQELTPKPVDNLFPPDDL